MTLRFGLTRGLKALGYSVIAASATLALNAHSASAGVIGDVLIANYLYPNIATVYDSVGGATVTTSTIFNFAKEGVMINFTQNDVVITNESSGIYGPAAFNGIDLNVFSGASITNASIDTTLSSSLFAAGALVSFTNTDLYVNLAGTCGTCTGGEKIYIPVNVGSNSVPEPGTLALLSTAIGFIATRRRRRSG